MQNDTYVRTVPIDYHDGERHPHLEPVESALDYLDEISRPLTPAPPAAKEHRESGR